MRIKGNTKMLPFQNGILASTRALTGLKEYLETNYNFKLIKTRRLNQDVIEHFLGASGQWGAEIRIRLLMISYQEYTTYNVLYKY